MRIILTAIENPLFEAWQRFCGDLECVEVVQGSIFDVRCDAAVSPANSFGFMDGGIDLLYSSTFGWHVQERLQRLIQDHHHGELLVGTAEIVETDHERIPYLVSAPTMRVPTILRDTVNPFLAARAALLLVTHGLFRSGSLVGQRISETVTSVALPGLGTGVGRVGPNTCARQVRAAIEEVLLGQRPFPQTWAEAQKQHQLLYRDRVADLQYDE